MFLGIDWRIWKCKSFTCATRSLRSSRWLSSSLFFSFDSFLMFENNKLNHLNTDAYVIATVEYWLSRCRDPVSFWFSRLRSNDTLTFHSTLWMLIRHRRHGTGQFFTVQCWHHSSDTDRKVTALGIADQFCLMHQGSVPFRKRMMIPRCFWKLYRWQCRIHKRRVGHGVGDDPFIICDAYRVRYRHAKLKLWRGR